MPDTSPTTACPDAAALRALLDGTLPDDQQTATQAHVDRCSTCEAALRQMTAGGESWIEMAEKLKDSGEDDPKLAAALERLKVDDGSGGESSEPATDPQRTLDFLQPADDPKLLGKLGQHEISEVVGWGGMGVVLKAYDPSLHRVVAVKVLASHLAHHAVARKRFIREAQAAAAVCHDNVVTIHAIEDGVSGFGEPGSVSPRMVDANAVRGLTHPGSPNAVLPKIIMQFVAGGSLQERIDQEAPLELKEILRIAMQTAAGLAAAHAQGVVHRDVKPANILLENGVQRVKLTDFGLARVMDDASLTLSGVIAGTPQYMAPEQAWGRDVDARADLFSLGAVMYAMCSGHSPFRARTTMAVLKRVCEDAPRPLRAINPDVPDWLVALIEKLLAKNPDERIQSATEVSELLGRWLAHVQQPNIVPAPESATPTLTADDVAPAKSRFADSMATDATSEKSWLTPVVIAAFVIGMVPMFAAGQVSAYPELTIPGLTTNGTASLLRMLAIACWCLIPAGQWLFGEWTNAREGTRRGSARRGSPDSAALPDRRSPEFSRGAGSAGDQRSNPSAGSGDSRTARGDAARGQLPVKFVVWPLVVMLMLLGLMFAVVIAESGTHNVASFLGFSAIQLLATFVLASVFRAAWNSTSWVVWIASLLFLPFVASLFGLAASYRDASPLTQWVSALQALTAVAYWLGLLFVRPLFVQESDPRLAARPFRWRRVLALSGILLVPVMASVIWLIRANNHSDRMTEAGPRVTAETVTVDSMGVSPTRDPRRPQLDDRGFPNPQLLSDTNHVSPRRAEGVSPPVDLDLFEPPLSTAPTGGLAPPARQGQSSRRGQSASAAAVAESLKPLLGRWVVLTLQGNEPPIVIQNATGGGFGGGPPMAGLPAAGAPSTPTLSDQLQYLNFQGNKLTLATGQQTHFDVTVANERELLLVQPELGPSPIRHGVFTIADDRLVICWASANSPLPCGFQPNVAEQLVVCRREWSRPSQMDGKGNDVAVKFDENSKPPKAEMPFSPREAAALQAAWAEKSKSPVEVTNSVGMKLRVIPPGSFGDPRVATLAQSVGGAGSGFGGSGGMMGGGDAFADGGAASGSTVGRPRSGERGYGTVSGPILVGAHEVTVAQFRQFVEDSKYVAELERDVPADSPHRQSWLKPEIEQDSDQHPVVNVTFEDALAFCHWLSQKEKKPYRLLTRREWEFCARAGSWLPATLGPGKLPYRSQFFTTTAPVGSYSANSFGLHDFIGNVAEWAWHNDLTSENDPRRSAPNSGIWTGDPTVFCGGDFRQHINRSQPSEWLHPSVTTTHPTIGFRVACDLTAVSAVSVPKNWPMNQLFVSQEFVRVRTLANTDVKNEVPPAQPDGRLISAVWLEMLVRAEQMPYAVEWLDFEIERRATPKDETDTEFALGRIADAGAEEGWKPIDLEPALRLLDQTEFAPDPIAAPFLNAALTMPLPKAVSGQWASPDKRRGLPPEFVRLEPAIQKPQLFRFIDFDTPHGSHYYRVRLKYRVPGIVPETVQSTSWFHSMEEAEVDFDFDPRKPPANMPVIELKSQPPVDPLVTPTDNQGFGKRRRPTTSSPSN